MTTKISTGLSPKIFERAKSRKVKSVIRRFLNKVKEEPVRRALEGG